MKIGRKNKDPRDIPPDFRAISFTKREETWILIAGIKRVDVVGRTAENIVNSRSLSLGDFYVFFFLCAHDVSPTRGESAVFGVLGMQCHHV